MLGNTDMEEEKYSIIVCYFATTLKHTVFTTLVLIYNAKDSLMGFLRTLIF